MKERFETFTVLTAKISRNIRKIKNQEMLKYDLKSPHISCLYFLYCADTLTATELCERCEEDKATISRSLDYLEKMVLLPANQKPKNGIKALLCLPIKVKKQARLLRTKSMLFLMKSA